MRWIWPQQTIAITISVEFCSSVPSNAALPWHWCLHMGSYSFQSCFCQLLHGDVLQVPWGHQWSVHKSVQSELNKNFTTRKALIISAWLQASTYSKFVLWYARVPIHTVKDLRYDVTLLCTYPNCLLNVLPVHKNTSSRLEAFLMALRQARICRNATKLSGITTGRQTSANTLGMQNPTTLTPVAESWRSGIKTFRILESSSQSQEIGQTQWMNKCTRVFKKYILETSVNNVLIRLWWLR